MNTLRPGLPEMIPAIAKLPIDERGYPVPYFVQWISSDNDGTPMPVASGVGKPDFRVMNVLSWNACMKEGRCWICGDVINDRTRTFVIGPMCSINRTTAEPGSHEDCATWAVKACPFLANPEMRRNEHNSPGNLKNTPGIAIAQNPGVSVLWTSGAWKLFKTPNGPLIHVGEPKKVEWWKRSRIATRAEVEEAIKIGFPRLVEMCKDSLTDDIVALIQAKRLAEKYLPES